MEDAVKRVDWTREDDPELKGLRYCAVCRLGEGRWYWCCSVWDDELQAVADGKAVSREDAMSQVQDVLGRRRDGHLFHWRPDLQARNDYRRILARERKANPHTGQRASVTEYLYHHYYSISDYGGEPSCWTTHPHRITKKTPRFIFAVRYCREHEEQSQLQYSGYLETIRFDRQRLEAGEESWRRDFCLGHFSLSPTPCRDDGGNGDCPEFLCAPLGTLELSWPCTAKEVRAAYRRLARERHPDAGGSCEAFVSLQKAYELALPVCEQYVPAAT